MYLKAVLLKIRQFLLNRSKELQNDGLLCNLYGLLHADTFNDSRMNTPLYTNRGFV